jgi:hypothetical protein
MELRARIRPAPNGRRPETEPPGNGLTAFTIKESFAKAGRRAEPRESLVPDLAAARGQNDAISKPYRPRNIICPPTLTP